jgi:hypothetical protein
MKKKRLLLFLTVLILIGLVVNSCKKDSLSPIQQLFTGGTWRLASIQDTLFVGNTEIAVDTLNTTCDSTQNFTFYTNNTCTYTNFDCLAQSPPAGQWSLAPNERILQANIVCKDTTATGSSMPFANAKILNLGQFSLILETGDFQANYSLTARRRVVVYGFIRQKVNGSD